MSNNDENFKAINLSNQNIPKYQPGDPYHWTYDNKPLLALAKRDEIIADQLNKVIKIIKDTNLENLIARINVSVNLDGTLKSIAIDNANHKISEHEDADGYVRMTDEERAILAEISNNAKNISFEFKDKNDNLIGTVDNGIVVFQNTNEVSWELDNNVVKAKLEIPTSYHQHFYQVRPQLVVNENTGIATGYVGYIYKAGSLRVYVNGSRIYDSEEKSYYPVINDNGVSVSLLSWKKVHFIENSTNGSFTFSGIVNVSDVVFVDFDAIIGYENIIVTPTPWITNTPVPTSTLVPTKTPTPTPTKTPTPTPTKTPTPTPTPTPTKTPTPTPTKTPTPTPTKTPTPTPTTTGYGVSLYGPNLTCLGSNVLEGEVLLTSLGSEVFSFSHINCELGECDPRNMSIYINLLQVASVDYTSQYDGQNFTFLINNKLYSGVFTNGDYTLTSYSNSTSPTC